MLHEDWRKQVLVAREIGDLLRSSDVSCRQGERCRPPIYRGVGPCGRQVPCHAKISHFILYTPLKAENPPSMGTTTPVTKAEAGLTSQSSVPNRSSGRPRRPDGVWV